MPFQYLLLREDNINDWFLITGKNFQSGTFSSKENYYIYLNLLLMLINIFI